MKLIDLFAALMIVVLGLNAWMTRQLLKEFRLFRWHVELAREGKDGQTINVNLGATGLAATQQSLPASATMTVPTAPEPAAIEEPELAPPPPPHPRPIVSVSVTSSGTVAIKCPKCGAENSAFRTECFMCETTLR